MAPVSSGRHAGDPGDPTVVPNLSVVLPMKGALEGMTVGASIGAPFGLKTDYEPGWVGRYRALTSDLKTVDLTLSVAFKATDGVSIGAGLIYERAEATLSKAIDFGTAICPASNPANCFNPVYPFKPQQLDGAFPPLRGGHLLAVRLQHVGELGVHPGHRIERVHGALEHHRQL